MNTIEQLKGYLGTGLKMIFKKSGRCFTLNGLMTNENENLIFIDSLQEKWLQKHWNFKPLLHPLSRLTVPISVEGYNNGEEFVPIIELAKLFHKNYKYPVTHYRDAEIQSGWIAVKCCVCNDDSRYMSYQLKPDITTNSYKVIQLLYQWHFAIDIEDFEEIEI
jgi:hypothetical protein